ncbi:MAG: APC family permease [Candidatus Bathyarchaeia archaeon]
MTKTPPTFVRDATGLVREVGAWPSFFATFALVTGGVPILLIATLWTAPGANWTLALLTAFVPSLAFAALAVIMAISMPRSGADYVFTSRALHPFLGFVSYFALVSAFTLNYGIFSSLGATYVGYILTSLGSVWNDPNLANIGATLSSPIPAFVISVATITITGLIGLLRPRHAWGFIFWAGVISLVATAIFFGAMATISPSTFQAAYDAFVAAGGYTLASGNSTVPATYSQVISVGGLPSLGPMAATFAALPFAWFTYTWYTLPASWSGEMKHVKKSMFIAIIAALVWIAIYFILFEILSFNAFGQGFLEAWSNLNTGGGPPVAGIGNFTPFFVFLVYKSAPLLFVMFIALFLPNFLSLPAILISQTRYLFSWAWDRILPERIAAVNERTHTPLIAGMIILAGAYLGAALVAFAPDVGIVTTTFPIFTFGFIIPAFGAAAFPYLKRDLYESSVIVKRKVAGVPVITWLGGLAGIYLIFSTYLAISVGNLPLNLQSGLTYLVIFGLGIVIYAVGYFNAKRKGIPIELVFKQIPPE